MNVVETGRGIARLMAAAAMAAALVAGAPGAAQAKDNLVVALLAEPVTFDLTQVRDLNSGRVVRRIYEGLTDFVYGTYDIGPGLAESWEISDDGLTYTFNLRQGVTFHDGTDFDAAAVIYNWQRQIDPTHPGHGAGVYPLAANYLGNVAEMEAVDAHTLRITLKEPMAPFLQYLTQLTVNIASPAAIEKFGADIATNPVGTGPYKLTEWRPGVRAVLAANEDWWGGDIAIKQLIYVPIVEAQARLSAITTGEVDFTYDVPIESLDVLRANPEVTVQDGLSAHVWYVTLNVTLSDPPLDNKLVRQALNYAIDKEAIVDDILMGAGVISRSPLSPIYGDNFNPGVRHYDYDPEKAKALLAEAGFPDGFRCEFMVPESGSGMQSPLEMGTFIQANLAAVGVNCSIQTMEWGAYLNAFRNGPQMAQMSWNSVMGDPDYVLWRLFNTQAHPPAWNAGFYSNPEVDALLDRAQVVVDPAERTELYLKAQELIVEDAPWIFVNHGAQIVAHSARLEDFRISPNFDFIFERARIE